MQTLPVVEIFGPTIQGEGPDVGKRCCFVRLAGCDFQCSWCDSAFSWKSPQFVRMTGEQIVKQLAELDPPHGPGLVILTGGNPLLHDCSSLLDALPAETEVVVETQGTIHKSWLRHPKVKVVVVSPKLASAGMYQNAAQLYYFLSDLAPNGLPGERAAVKVVVFSENDVREAVDKFYQVTHDLHVPFTFQVGTLPDDTAADILARYLLIWQAVLATDAKNVRVLPQLHVLLWGHKRGV